MPIPPIAIIMKELIWQGSSYDDLKAFPMDAKQNAGFQLHKVQQGDDPNDWKPMPRIGKGVREIRIKVESGEFRVIYCKHWPENLCATLLSKENPTNQSA